MKPIQYDRGMEDAYPHAADVFERDVAEGGFSAGWCPHAKPTIEYLYDFHVHYADRSDAPLHALLAPTLSQVEAYGALRALLLLRLHGDGQPDPHADPSALDKSYTPQALRSLLAGMENHPQISLAAWLHHSTPDKALVQAANALGIRAIKLHNAPLIEDAGPCDIWLSHDWQDAFAAMAQANMPVLWHVTQRLPGCTYTGGGKNTYWKKGWENGVAYGNEALLQVFLTCCQRNPDVNFVGAHQLHIGWERLDTLFAGYPNLYVDTTVGCRLHMDDQFYPQDKAYLRAVFIRWSDRIVFGTDSMWSKETSPYTAQMLAEHRHFLTALDLPEDALDNICHRNAERLLGLSPLGK